MKSASLASDVPPGADGAEQDLILLQRRRLEHDGGAVRQRPLGDAGLGRAVVFTIVPRVGRRIHQRLPGGGVHVRLEPLRRGGLDDGRELRLIGQDDAGGFGRGHDDQPVPVGEPVARRAR